MKNLLLLVVSSLLFNSILFSQDEVTSNPKGLLGEEQIVESPFLDLNNYSKVVQKLFPSDDKNFLQKKGVVDVSDVILFGGYEIGKNTKEFSSNSKDRQEISLITAKFKIPENAFAGKIFLEITEMYELEAGNDLSKIYIRRDKGEDWILLDSRSGLKNWDKTYIDLTKYNGNFIQLKFEFKTSSSFESTSWAIRDINIVSLNQDSDNTVLSSQIENESHLSQDEKYKIAQSDLDITDDNKDSIESLTEQFTEQTSISLTGVLVSSVAWGDYDNDGDLDILLTGSNNNVFVSKIYKNNGDGTYTDQTSISLTGVSSGSVAWGDYDNDGDLDILLTGFNGNVNVSKIYKNNGDGTFTEQTSISLTGVGISSVAWGDYDNDGDLDILLTGYNSSYVPVSKIYKNNGDGTFAEQTSISLTAVSGGTVAWGDYDNDRDLDILVTGSLSNGNPVSKIYKNNGDGTFTEQTSISITGVSGGSEAWGDYDNDGDLDILLTGDIYNGRISKIYKNNGDGTFTEQTSISLTGVYYSSVAWGDYDNDGDLDILLTGASSSNIPISKIYKNNGDGTFTEQISISLTGVSSGSVAWGDYDNDGDLDILLTGNSGNGGVSKIYKNNNIILNTVPNAPTNLNSTVNGNNVTFNWNKSTDNKTPQNGLNYNLVIGTTANSVNTLSPMADKATGFRRVVRLGNSQTNSWTIKNLPMGTYYWSVQAIDGAYAGSQFASAQTFSNFPSVSIIKPNGGENWVTGETDTIKWNSVNVNNVKLEYSTDGGENWTTIIGSIPSANLNYLWEIPNFPSAQCKVRISDVVNPSIADTSDNLFTIRQQFTEQTSISLTGVNNSSVAWGDYDNDGDLDFLLTGYGYGSRISKIYKNNGDGTFTEQTSIFLTGVNNSSVAWGDYDNDGDLDILLTGYSDLGFVSKIYKNNGDGTFTEQTSISLMGVANSSVAWGDYDNDGDLDILLSGNDLYNVRVSKIYKNNGNGTFTEQTSISLTGVSNSSVAWGDYDNDGDLDILLTGRNSSDVLVSKIYKNTGDGTFTEQTSNSITGVWQSSVAWGDYDNDGDLDILLTGQTSSGYVSEIYKNGGDGTFTGQTSISLTGGFGGSVAWGDYDNDGDLDILLTGNFVSKIYKNNGDETFTEQTSISLTGVSGSVAWGDYDNDGDLDILLVGRINSNGDKVSKIYKNNNAILNTVPNAPTNLTSTVNGDIVTFNWNKSTDNETPQNGLHYNLVIGTTANSVNTLSPMADRTTGFRRVVRLGNSQANSWTIKNLPMGTYYWSVQAIDGTFSSSQFASAQTFSNITSISIIKPNGGEILRGGVVDTIKWTSINVTNVKLEYTSDNGLNWLTIIASTEANAGRYEWTVPNTPSTNCKVRISDTNIPTLNDLSDNTFTILPQVPTIPQLASPANNSKGVVQPATSSWNKSLRVENYKLQVSTDSLFGALVVNDSTLTDTTKLLPNLANYSQYYWRVKAVNVGGESDWSTVWNFKTLGNPYASNLITPLDASVNQPVAGLTFKWTKAQERIESIQKYQLQISTDSLFATTLVNDSTLTDTTKVVGGMGYLTKYFWRVRAQNQTGWGDWSNTWQFTTIVEIPTVPLLASPVNNATQQLLPVVLKWRHSPRVEKYTLEVSESSNFTTLFLVDSTMTDTMRTLPQLQTPKTYYWRVKASNIGGTSEYSTVWNFRTLGFPIVVNLIAPENGSVNLPINDVLLKWSTAGEQTLGSVTSGGKGVNKAKSHMEPSIDGEGQKAPRSGNMFTSGGANPASGIESIGKYWLEIKTDTTNSALFYSDSTLTDTTKLMSGFGYLTTYYWRVKANNEVGWGSFSGWFRFTTVTERPGITVLSSPANNSLGLIQPVVMKWRSAIRAERYTLEVSENNNFLIFAVRDTNITDTTKVLSSLSPLKDYYWRVFAVNAGGKGDTSSVWRFKTLGTPATLNLVYPENNAINIPTSLTFRWNKGHDQETVSRYWFELVLDTTAGIVVRDTLLTDTLRTVNQIQHNFNYFWRVKAKNEAGWGEFTGWNKFTTIVDAPGQTVLSLPANNTSFVAIKPTFKWRKVTGAEKYHLQVATDLNFTNIVLLDSMLTDTTKTLTTDSLNYKTKYYWRVKAQNIGGTGIYSVVWNFTTKKKPIATPTVLTATATAVKRVTLSWADNSDNELGFIILRKTGDSTSTASLLRIDTVGVDVTEFIDSTVTDTSYYSYRVMAYNADTLSTPSYYATVFTLTGIKDFLSDIPKEFTLYQNYPNPFNPSTIIRFALPKDSHVEIELYSIHGELLNKLVSEDKQAGYYEISLEIPSYASGIYFYRIVASPGDKSEPFVQTRKFILMK